MDKRYIFYRIYRRFKDIFIIRFIDNRNVVKIKLIILIFLEEFLLYVPVMSWDFNIFFI